MLKKIVFIQVRKKIVDLFEPRNEPRPPSFQLRAEALNQEEIMEFNYPLSLIGTNEPEFKLRLKPTRSSSRPGMNQAT